MKLYREIELSDSTIVREELEKIVNSKSFLKKKFKMKICKERKLHKMVKSLSDEYSKEELELMVETLNKEENRDSVTLSKWIGFVALGLATITLFCTMFIALYDSLDEKDVEIKINIALGINFIIFSIPTAFILIKTISIYRLESKQYKTRSIFIALINAALKQKV